MHSFMKIKQLTGISSWKPYNCSSFMKTKQLTHTYTWKPSNWPTHVREKPRNWFAFHRGNQGTVSNSFIKTKHLGNTYTWKTKQLNHTVSWKQSNCITRFHKNQAISSDSFMTLQHFCYILLTYQTAHGYRYAVNNFPKFDDLIRVGREPHFVKPWRISWR
jgi:hypothetical protein